MSIRVLEAYYIILIPWVFHLSLCQYCTHIDLTMTHHRYLLITRWSDPIGNVERRVWRLDPRRWTWVGRHRSDDTSYTSSLGVLWSHRSGDGIKIMKDSRTLIDTTCDFTCSELILKYVFTFSEFNLSFVLQVMLNTWVTVSLSLGLEYLVKKNIELP